MLDKIKAYGFQALALALLALSIWLGFQVYGARLDAEKARSALSAEQTSRARENTERMRVALDDARATFRKSETHARNQQEIADAHAKQERARAAALAAAAADGERLRDQVRAFAAACGGGEAQSVAAAIRDCRDRAATLGELYDEADRQAEEFAGAAEKHADEIRTLKRVIVNDRALTE
jgi:hypothetical protein